MLGIWTKLGPALALVLAFPGSAGAAGSAPGQAIPPPANLAAELQQRPGHQAMDVALRWEGIGDPAASYEVEQVIRHREMVGPFRPLGARHGSEQFPDGHFEFVVMDAFLPGFEGWMCYRVRAVIRGNAGPHTGEVCVPGPQARGTPSTATPPPLTTPTPLPTLSQPPLDPLNPLKIRYAPAEGGPPGSFAFPDLEGAPLILGAEAIRQAAPGAAFLDEADATGLITTLAEARVGPGGTFSAKVVYLDAEGRRLVTLGSWSRTGDFEYVAPGASPVTRVRQTMVGGLYAITVMPTEAVVGGVAPREVYFTTGDRIYHLGVDAWALKDDRAVMAIAERLALQATGAPGAPEAGTGHQREARTAIPQPQWAAISIIVVCLAALAGFAVAAARKR